MTAATTTRRRWFRFSLRTGFILLTLLCVWLAVQVKWIRDRREVANESRGFYLDCLSVSPADTAAAPWSLRILGEPGYGSVYVHVADVQRRTANDDRLGIQAHALFPEAEVVFVHTENFIY